MVSCEFSREFRVRAALDIRPCRYCSNDADLRVEVASTNHNGSKSFPLYARVCLAHVPKALAKAWEDEA